MNEHEAQPTPEHEAPSSPPRSEFGETEGRPQGATLAVDFPGDTAASSRPEYDTNISPVREGIRSYGRSFLAYLILDGVEQRAPDIVEQFKAHFYEYYPDRDAFIRDQLDRLGWQQRFLAFCEDNRLWPGDLRWDPDVLWEHLNRLYRTTERLGGVYVFTR